MTLDQRITDAARHVADGVVVPEVDLDAVRSRARGNRRQRVAIAVTVVVAAIIVTGTAVVSGRDASAPEPAHPVRPPQIDGPPLTPYWHDGVLYVRGVEIETPWRHSPAIEVAGDTVLAGAYGQRGVDPAWALVAGDRLEPVPIPDMYPRLSLDGRIAYWWTYPTADSTRVVTWDTETNRELASRDLPGSARRRRPAELPGGNRRGRDRLLGGRGQRDPRDPVGRPRRHRGADARPEVVRPALFRRGNRQFFQNQFVSPDGTKELFTPDAPGDKIIPPLPEIWVRPVGSEDPSDVVRLRVPESRYNQPLYDFKTHKGTQGVWWETNETVLVTVLQESVRTDLMRCSVTDGACALVFELEPDDSGFIDWSFAHFPTTG